MIAQSTRTSQVDLDTFYNLMQAAGELQAAADNIRVTRDKALTAYNSAYCTKGAAHPDTLTLYALYTSAAQAWKDTQSRADSKRTLARTYAR